MIKFPTISEKATLAISALVAFLLLVCVYFQSNGMLEGGQDSYNHFLISKFAFKYPYLLLDQWGKPVYTILAHPFCSLGLGAAVFFNILCLVLAGVFTGLLVLKLDLKYAWLACWICIFAPISLGNAIATLTEPLNMLLLSIAFYTWVCDKKVLSTFVFSLLPWIRTEGFVIMVPFLVFLIISKHYKYLPILFSGTFIVNLLGWYQTGKPFWFITENPYYRIEADAERFAPEPGSFFYYVDWNNSIFGKLGLVFAALGVLSFLYWAFVKTKLSKHRLFIFLVVLGVFVAYYFAHSFIIWKGMLGTHGMLRVMVVIVPTLAFFIVYFFNFLFAQLIRIKPIYIYSGLLLWAGVFTYKSYRINEYPTQFYNFSKIAVKQVNNIQNLDKAYQYIENNSLTDRVLYHQLPIFDVRYNRDPFAKPLSPTWKTAYIWSIDLNANWAPKNSIIIWDSYHAQREGNMPLDKILSSTDYKLLTQFVDDPNKAGDNDIYLFEKVK